ncbi:ABC transporter six-transmembrane domain-containing protein [Edwardsiella tarda]|uniref:ABC transporter six-transmembrane domain-containing protein n=1 Tax=Edwardsiella tarda TaxID=636 RepID=UPI00351C7B55
MTPPTHAPHAVRGVLPPASPSVRRTLLSIARRNPLALLVTFALITLENLLLVTYPLFAGYAIDAIVQGEGLKASSYALIVLLFWLIGALRRSVDTRTFTRLSSTLAVSVILAQRQRRERSSTIIARVTLAREFIDFFERHLPLLMTSLIALIGAVTMLLVLEFWLGLASLGVMMLGFLLLPAYARGNQRLHQRLHDRLEREAGIIGGPSPRGLARHYQILARLRVAISDRESLAYLIVGIGAALLFLLAIVLLSRQPQIAAGHVYAVMAYLWNFVNSLDESPTLTDQLARLRDIAQRVAAE